MARASQNVDGSEPQSLELQSETSPITFLARDVFESLGYAQWRNFSNLVRRAEGLINSGEATGCITRTSRRATIGSGATRSVVDYIFDAAAYRLISELSAGFKLNGHYHVRNETAIIRLLQKYFLARGTAVVFQARVGSAVYDCLIGGKVVVEIDEPHHAWRRQSVRDRKKDEVALSQGLVVTRFAVEHDVVDIVLAVEAILAGVDRNGAMHKA